MQTQQPFFARQGVTLRPTGPAVAARTRAEHRQK
jgi:hypothetical protein